MLTETEQRIHQVYSQLRSKIRSKRHDYGFIYGEHGGELPFPWSRVVITQQEAPYKLTPEVVELLDLTAQLSGRYPFSRISYHPNSLHPQKPFICEFDVQLPDGDKFESRLFTTEVALAKTDTNPAKLIIKENETPTILIPRDWSFFICQDALCPDENGCKVFGYTLKVPETKRLVDPLSIVLEAEGIPPEESDPFTKYVFYQRMRKSRSAKGQYNDDYTVYESTKQFGLVSVLPIITPEDWIDPSTGFSLKKHDRYLEIHLDEPALHQIHKAARSVSRSFEQIADYILLHNLQPKYVVGITYEKLARMARSFGFLSFPLAVSDEIYQGLEKGFKEENPRGKKGLHMGEILVLFQDTDSFLQRYAA